MVIECRIGVIQFTAVRLAAFVLIIGLSVSFAMPVGALVVMVLIGSAPVVRKFVRILSD